MAQDGGRGWRILALQALFWAGPLVAAGSLNAAEPESETRDFNIRIDNKPAGHYHMTIERTGDDTLVISAEASAKVSYLIYTYRYSYEGREVWKKGRLWELTSKANDNGKKYTVTATASDTDLRVTTNGKGRATRWDVWTTTYWHAPDAKFRDQVVPLLDADTGKDINSNLTFVGVEPVTYPAGEVHKCMHYRLRGGGLEVDLWYDANDRMVRQESIEDGHKTVLELARLTQGK
jgi:hypothetical protein